MDFLDKLLSCRFQTTEGQNAKIYRNFLSAYTTESRQSMSSEEVLSCRVCQLNTVSEVYCLSKET